jgi:hypothetical protein
VTRQCCCGAACDCAPTNASPIAYAGTLGDFTYTVDFPGSSKGPFVQSRVSQVTTQLRNHGPYGPDQDQCAEGMLCVDAFGVPCGPLKAIPQAKILDEDVEIETRTCGFELTNNVGVIVGYNWFPIANNCDLPGCPGGHLEAVQWGNGPIPKTIGGIQVAPKWLLGQIFSSAATIRFRRNTLRGFACDLTSSSNDFFGSPTVTAANCKYLHRVPSGWPPCPGTQVVNSCGQYFGYGEPNLTFSLPCIATDCCCRSELRVNFKVAQRIDERHWATTAPYPISVKPGTSTQAVITITAFYYGCTDTRLYSASSTQPAVRVFTLDRASVTYASGLDTVSRYGIGDVPANPLPYVQVTDCGALGAPNTSNVDNSSGCNFCSGSILSAASAFSMGVPRSVAVTRTTP